MGSKRKLTKHDTAICTSLVAEVVLLLQLVNRISGNVRATGGHLLSIWSQVAGVHAYTELFTPRGQNPGHRSQQLRRDREAQATNHRPPTLDTHGFMYVYSRFPVSLAREEYMNHPCHGPLDRQEHSLVGL